MFRKNHKHGGKVRGAKGIVGGGGGVGVFVVGVLPFVCVWLVVHGGDDGLES
jgi:hypothetical protein